MANGGPQMGIVQRAGEEPALPEMAGPAVAAVDGLGVAHVKGFESALKAVFSRRNRYKMDMIVHQAVGEDIDPVFPAIGR